MKNLFVLIAITLVTISTTLANGSNEQKKTNTDNKKRVQTVKVKQKQPVRRIHKSQIYKLGVEYNPKRLS